MTARALRDALVDALANDATFAAAVAVLIGQSVTKVLPYLMPMDQIPAHDVPCFMVDCGDGVPTEDGDDEGLTIGNSSQDFTSNTDVWLVWHDQNRAAAANARTDLSTLFVQLLLRNPTLGGVNSAWCAGWSTDQGIKHPHHIFTAQIRAQYTINRS